MYDPPERWPCDVNETQSDSETSGNPTVIRLLIVGLSLFLALFHLYTGVFGTLNAMLQRSIHLGVALVLVFLIYPAKKGAKGTPGVSNYIFLALTIVSMGYLYWNAEYLTQERISMLTPATLIETALGICLISVVLEGVRRTLGMPLAIVVAVFILYYVVGPYFPSDGIGYAALGLRSLYRQSIPVAGRHVRPGPWASRPRSCRCSSSSDASCTPPGFGGFLTDFAMGVAGRTRGGPAKVAIISSALFGTINGSATANALTTGNFTIPLMKRSGYSSHFSAGVEASASTGGQIMPPIMGAAAFLMAEFARIPYVTIMQYAIFPAILFFLGIFVTVDLEAKKLRLKGLGSDELPDWKSQVPKYLHLLVPIGILIWLIVQNRSLMYSITVSIIALFVFAYLRSATRMNWRALFDALVASSRDILGVAMATAAVGIIVGIVGLTGLGIKLSSLMVDLSVGNLLASLLLAFLRRDGPRNDHEHLGGLSAAGGTDHTGVAQGRSGGAAGALLRLLLRRAGPGHPSGGRDRLRGRGACPGRPEQDGLCRGQAVRVGLRGPVHVRVLARIDVDRLLAGHRHRRTLRPDRRLRGVGGGVGVLADADALV